MNNLLTSNWQVAERPGYLGSWRNEIHSRWNNIYGENQWIIAYEFGAEILSFEQALELYEESYFAFLKKNPKILSYILEEASEVYDTAPSNVQSGTNWKIQETSGNHLQDIAVRRVLKKMNLWFKGHRLLQIRGPESDLFILNPGQIPFVEPEKIHKPRVFEDVTWIKENSLEDFWQNNKVLLIKK